MKKSHILIKNISSNFFAQLWLMVISFFTTPIIFSRLGADKYGLLVLINTIPNYFSVLDFGLTASVIKKASELKAKKESLEILISTGLIAYTIITILWSIVIYFAANLLAFRVLKIPSNLINITIISLQLTAISFFLTSMTTFFSSIPQALQKFEIFNIKNFITGTFIPLGTIAVLIVHKGIIEIMYIYIIVNTITLIIFYVAAKLIYPNFRIRFNFSSTHLKSLLSFGGFKFISNINAKILFQLNNFLIATFLPISLVSYYSIPAGLTQKIVSLIPNITSPIFPLASELQSLSLKDKIKLLYTKSIKIVNLLVFPIIFFIFFFSHLLLSLWINEDFANIASPILKILSVSYLLASLPAVPKIVIEGIGKPKIPALFSTANSVIYVILALLFIPKYQIIGAAWAVLISRIIQVPSFLSFVTLKIIKIKMLKYLWENYFKVFICAIIAIIPFLIITISVNSLFILGIYSVLYFVLFLLIAAFFNIIDKQDKQILFSFFKIFKK